ncbi:hypothetical protein [Kineococcus radiotolerans]|uniref:Uncharacterized protein n=1 Tax=Kineococcus radiotolerans (strain ATCC BAA-149 / DSM 14245 / SRS30216) TaxID=266940 RepID=A6WGA3_KINRD|nr:hypothetical protein [Kineococcus radiotolerans]ABS05842.1 hypothetical protein Krad_4379 [Kineococcus radiotolerans SRS30216 = ATCC BAA-149]
MRKLTVVVTCSDRKSQPVAPDLRLRDVPEEHPESRAHAWDGRLRRAAQHHPGSQRPLATLYQGDHWAQAQTLPAAAARVGFHADLWVASAGLGLQPITAQAPAYAATFAARHLDRVAADACGRQQWWAALQARRGASTLADLARAGSLLMIFSEDYGHAVQEELHAVAHVGADALLIGGASDIDGLPRLAADRRLRSHLGGTLTSLNVRTALAWLQRLSPSTTTSSGSALATTAGPLVGGPTLTSTAAWRRWRRWSTAHAHEEVYDRRPLSDEQVRAYIGTRHALMARPSRTTLLRALREDGYACEQSRFGHLYTQVLQHLAEQDAHHDAEQDVGLDIAEASGHSKRGIVQSTQRARHGPSPGRDQVAGGAA